MKTTLHVSTKLLFRIIWFLIPMLQLSIAFGQAPANDNCGAAVTITSNSTCSNTTGTVANATNSGVAVGACTGTPDDDVWYRFVAVSPDQAITLSNIGSNLTTSGPRIQLFSGSCGSLGSIACGTTSIAVSTLTPGATYYVRVYSAGGAVLTTNAGFRICVTHSIIDFGKSYVNISKPSSGTVEPGDILEIRASVVVRAGIYDSCRFTDNIPAGTSYVAGSLSIRTNEGKIYKSFTDAQTDPTNDEGWITGTSITMNLGYNPADNPSTKYRRGRIASNHKPSFFGGTCIMMATYRVTVTAALGAQINTGGGSVTYTSTPPTLYSYTFPSNQVAIYTNYGMCSNAIGANSIGTEFNGTFGSGPTRNRGTSANVPVGYTYSPFTTNMPNDYYYGVANNTSTATAYTTSNTWPKPDGSSPTHRVFSVWDIIGDHTGAASPTAGNPATDTVANHNGGYMLVINAAYRIDSAFQQTISSLCPNTYYEISCWMRNICSKCGCDSNGTGASGGAGYIPTAAGDSSGVYPNVTFEVDGIDYYTTGYITYTGQWVKRGFTILTGPAQTSFTLKFFNNAPGGGGNDWALDDISVATCLPNMKYSPSITPTVCDSNTLTLYDTVRSYFNNYVNYKWQQSTNGGSTWSDVTAPAGPASPVWNGTAWQYVTNYTVPVSQTQISNSGDKYRLVVGTTISNLSNANCQFTDVGNIITMTVIDCGIPLETQLLSFTGRIINNQGLLKWITATENETLHFAVQKSVDGINFTTIATIDGYNDYSSEQNIYSFTDPVQITGKTYYRIEMRNAHSRSKYSRIIQLSQVPDVLSFVSIINPFDNKIIFEVYSDRNSKANAQLIDQFGKIVKNISFDMNTGVNHVELNNTNLLPMSIYILRVQTTKATIQRRVMKKKND